MTPDQIKAVLREAVLREADSRVIFLYLSKMAAARKVVDDLCRADALCLMAGEMTAQEMRTAQAVAKGIRAKVLAALEIKDPEGANG